MTSRSLLGELLRIQTLVAVLCGLVLSLGGTGATAILLRKHQDRELRSLGRSLCHTIEREQAESPNHTYAEAAKEALSEMALSQHTLEVVERRDVVASREAIDGWSSSGTGSLERGECATHRAARDIRVCMHACDEDHHVLVATPDIHGDPDVRLAIAALCVTFLLVLVAGTLLGRALIRRRLRPLQRLEEAATRLRVGSGAALGVGTSLTELARLEGAIDGLLRQLHEALQREKRFSQEASHELRTSLTVLRTRVDGIRGGAEAPERVRSEAEALIANLEAMDRLVEALLLLARSEEDSPLPTTVVNLCDLAREAVQTRRRMDGPGSPVPEVSAADEVLVSGSEELLGRALFNLTENARRFGGAGARILIRVDTEGSRALVTVEDDGPGIPDGSRSHVFERFFRDPLRRGVVPGTGLGLAVVRAIVIRHHGGVSTRASEALGGEAVRFWLPLLDPDHAGASDREPAPGLPLAPPP